ncbi:F-box only protein 31-like isoform X2 [Penaeus japonicus]|uniref:F-box only protein 31-like isoform X2 n=1 Tax=Penaeus japonicus TaxID=27405 RepID=UPI001C70D485|nr:F-box only protein 31-like isoform X2 [Penaeus japonicus]
MDTATGLRLTDLPEDLLLHIMGLCNPHDLTKLSATCTLLFTLSQCNSLWKPFCQRVTNIKDIELGEFSTYKKLYTTLLHKYGSLIGLYQAKFGPFGGLTEVRYSRGRIEGLTWDPASPTDIEAPLKHNILFSLKQSTYHTKDVCLPEIDSHHGAVILGKKDTFTLLCFSPEEHAKAVWKDFEYDQELFDFLQTHGKRLRYRSEVLYDWEVKCHQQKLLCLSHCFDFSMVHQPLILPNPRDIPELMPDGSCPKQLVAPGLFKGSDNLRGIELILLKYVHEKELRAFKITGDGCVPSGEILFSHDLKHPVSLLVQEEHQFEDLFDLEYENVVREGPVSDIPMQTFRVPQNCQGDVPSDVCHARYYGQGADGGPHGVQNTPVHVVVFDPDTVGVLWLEHECLTLYKRVHQTFNQHHREGVQSVL